jgi:hypothetical protein
MGGKVWHRAENSPRHTRLENLQARARAEILLSNMDAQQGSVIDIVRPLLDVVLRMTLE